MKHTIIVLTCAFLLLACGAENIVGDAKGGNKQSGGSDIWQVVQERGLQGEHFTLHLHGKFDDYQGCNYDPAEDGSYGNTVNFGTNPSFENDIIMESGNAKGKWAAEADTSWGVRDSCTSAFDGTPAKLVIPPNENGYLVVARALGKPTDEPETTLEGELVWVVDELGNDLLVLGLVTDDGFQTPTQTLTREKGKSTAIDITGLFEWSGSVCHFSNEYVEGGANYCWDETGTEPTYVCTDRQLCCTDPEGDGIYNECRDADYNQTSTEYYCADGETLDVAGCNDYVEEWVFNIEDYVGYMWGIDSTSNKAKVSVRFYPCPNEICKNA